MQKYQALFLLYLGVVVAIITTVNDSRSIAAGYLETRTFVVPTALQRPMCGAAACAIPIPGCSLTSTISPLISTLQSLNSSCAAVPAQMSEDFEGQWPSAGWMLTDQSGTDNGEFLWGKRDCHPRGGGFAAWAIGGGAQGGELDCAGPYANNTSSWMIYGPFDLSQATAARLTYYFWGESDASTPCGDNKLFVGSSLDGGQFAGFAICGAWFSGTDGNGYHRGELDLTAQLGQPQVWVAFAMTRDGTTLKPGFMIDDVALAVEYDAPCQTPVTPQLSTPANDSTTADSTPTFSWNGVANATAYNFSLAEEQGGFATPVLTATIQSAAYTAAASLAADTYIWRVRAHNTAGGCDEYSSWSDVFALTVTAVAATPSLAAIVNSDADGNYELSWSAVEGATGYTLEEQQDGEAWTEIYSGHERSRTVTGRAEGQWCYRVRAVGTAGPGAWSNVVCTVVDNVMPIADFTAEPLSGRVPLAVTFHNLSAGDFSLCEWDYGDGQQASTCDAAHTHTYQRAGLYTVTLTVSGSGGSSTLSRAEYIAVSRRCRPLTLTYTGGGNVPTAIPAASAGCPAETYVAGALINLTAAPDEGWQVMGWVGTDDDTSQAATNVVSMPDDAHTVTVQYGLICYFLQRQHAGQGEQPVASPDRSERCAADHYYAGEIIRLMAAPDEGWVVSGWEGAVVDGNDVRRSSLVMPASNHVVTINYERSQNIRQLYLPMAIAPGFYYAGPWESEPNDVADEANGPIYLGADYFGYPNDQEDYFSFELATAATIIVDLSEHTGEDPQLQIYYEQAEIANLVGAATIFPYHVEFAAQPGIYLIRIVSVGNYNQLTPYRLRASTIP